MLVKLSSKGQLVIPKEVRAALGLGSGSQLQLSVEGEKIVLEPIQAAQTIDALYGLFQGDDLLHGLEEEHYWEIQKEAASAP
jgi:AbrB family looped-hinge helix DNA binding protein